jgi:hypothetical protein
MSNDNVIPFGGVTYAPIPPDTILEKAAGQLREAVVIGWTPDGELYLSSSTSDLREVNWMLDLAKQDVMAMSLPIE